ncbi:MAG: hypothetical protein ACRDNS_13535 [Trebonia sp.]
MNKWTHAIARLATPDREVRNFLRELQGDGGWEGRLTSKGHIQLRHADVPKVIFVLPSTPSDWRSVRNTRSDIRRAIREARAAGHEVV